MPKNNFKLKSVSEVEWCKLCRLDVSKLLNFSPDDLYAGFSAVFQYWSGNTVDESALSNHAWRAYYVLRDKIDEALGDIHKKQCAGLDAANKPRTDSQQKTFDAESKPMKCAMFLDECIQDRVPTWPAASAETLNAWAGEFDALNTEHGQDWELIAKVLEFSQESDFWCQYILSGSKFRQKYFTMLGQMQTS